MSAEETYARVIPFIQYLRPDGRKAEVQIDRPDHIVDMAEELIQAGFRFEVEHLTTGHVSLTIFDPKEDQDVTIKVVPNGPAVPPAVDSLVENFYKKWKAS